MTAPARVLIVLYGAIGDVIRALPLAQRLRAGWPAARIAWAVEPPSAPMLERHPAVDEVIVFRRGEGAGRFLELLAAVRAWQPELTLDLQRHLKSGVSSWWSGARRRVGFNWRNSREGNRLFNTESIPPVGELTSKLGHYLAFADHLGLPPAPVSFGLTATADERARVAELLAGATGELAAVLAGTTWESKNWWPEATAAVCRGLRERGLVPVLVGGPGDVAFARAVQAAGAGPTIDLVGRTTLREVIAIMERARLALGPDTGPMHVAAAVGTPVIGLFGATAPERSGAWGFEHLSLRGDVPCAPCYLTRCPIGRLCMERITPAMVLEQVDRVLQGAAAAPAGDVLACADRDT